MHEINEASFMKMIQFCEEPVPTYPAANRTDEFSFELQPSDIHGVGVFARHFIEAGVRLDLWGDENTYRRIDNVERPFQAELIDRYGVDGFYPMFMNRLAIGWYLNHSANPNCESRADDHIYTKVPIVKGTELTINYETLKEVRANARL